MTRREELEAEIAEQQRMVDHYSQASFDAVEEHSRRLGLLRSAKAALAALPPDPPPFRVSEAVSRKAKEARRGPLTPPYYDAITDGDRVEHAALIQAWVEEQFPADPDPIYTLRSEIRAKAGLT